MNEISISRLWSKACTKYVSQHVWHCETHFSYLASGKILHLSNWIHLYAIQWPECTVLSSSHWFSSFTKAREHSVWHVCVLTVCLKAADYILLLKKHEAATKRLGLHFKHRCHAPCGLHTLKRPSWIWHDPEVSSWLRHLPHVSYQCRLIFACLSSFSMQGYTLFFYIFWMSWKM